MSSGTPHIRADGVILVSDAACFASELGILSILGLAVVLNCSAVNVPNATSCGQRTARFVRSAVVYRLFPIIFHRSRAEPR